MTNKEQEDERIVDKRAASRMGDDEQAEPRDPQEPETPEEAEVDDVAAVKQQAEQYYKNWQRAAADFANFKRRVEQEKGESSRFERASLVINLLPIYDDLDRAVESVDASLAGLNWVQGVAAIHQKFGRLLEAMGVSEIPAEGEAFDPAQHEAIGRQPGPDGQVLHVAQKGYRLGDRVIRPAMVIVGSKD